MFNLKAFIEFQAVVFFSVVMLYMVAGMVKHHSTLTNPNYQLEMSDLYTKEIKYTNGSL